MIDQIANQFVALRREDQIVTLSVLAHLLPTSGVDFDEEEEHSIEHTIDMLQKLIYLSKYIGPTREELLDRIKLLSAIEEEVSEYAEEPGSSYVNPDIEEATPEKTSELIAEEARK